MDKYIDLHIHSQYSEGDFSIADILRMAQQYSIEVLSITDHNTVAGVPKLMELAPQYNIQAISGVEIYTDFNGKKFHLCGYNFSPQHKTIVSVLKQLQQDNLVKIKKSIQNLKEVGFIIEEDKIYHSPSHNYGVVHILKEVDRHPQNIAKIIKELPPEKQDFFGKVDYYFSRGRPGFLPLSELPTIEAIDIIKQCGGFTSLAHPGQQLRYEGDPIIKELIKYGLDGLEVISPYHTWHQIEHYQDFAQKNNLTITGGSDFHGDIDFTKQESIKRQWDYFKVPYEVYNKLTKKL